MSGNGYSSDAVRMMQFRGKKEEYGVWNSQFRALCAVKGCAEALEMSFRSTLPASNAETLDPTTDEGKAWKKAKVQNALAMSYLTLAFDSPKLLKMIQASKSPDWPSGLAYVLMAKLTKKYKPSDMMALAEMNKKLGALKLNRNTDPKELEDEIVEIKNQYDCPMDETHRVTAVMAAAGKHYADII